MAKCPDESAEGDLNATPFMAALAIGLPNGISAFAGSLECNRTACQRLQKPCEPVNNALMPALSQALSFVENRYLARFREQGVMKRSRRNEPAKIDLRMRPER
jgi:hypothetical protein